MRQNPKDWRIEDVETIAHRHGSTRLAAKGSHTKFSHDRLPEILTIPIRRPIKPIYIKQLIALIEKLEELPTYY